MKEGRIRSIALALTLTAHFGFIGGVGWVASSETRRLNERAETELREYQHIEAGLAVRSKSTKGRKTKQPQKDIARKVSPNDIVVAKDDQQKPPDPKDDKKKDEPKPEEEFDPESVFKKHREGAEGKPNEDPAVAETGADEESQTGQADGHDFGRLESAKGDPYAGELLGRMTVNPDFIVPSVVPDEPRVETMGCIKLSPDGKVANVNLDPEHKSSNSAFNSAVLRRLKETTDMEQPVPAHLREMLVENWACFLYHN